MKPKFITVDNYREFKPSEFVRSFVSDIEVAEKMGKPMNMMDFKGGHGCLPCLGGMACMNMKADRHDENSNVGYWVSELGDSIRMGGRMFTVTCLNNLFKKDIPIDFFGNLEGAIRFNGLVQEKNEFTMLKNQVHLYADALEKAGY